MSSLQYNELILDLTTPKVMGIINLNRDSFYKNSQHQTIDTVSRYIDLSLEEGMDIIDLGAFSSRPGAELGNTEEERKRLIPILTAIRQAYPDIFISVDTYDAAIVEMAIDAGANMINDISGGSIDTKMFDMIATKNIPYVLMHMQGLPGTMQQAPNYENVVFDILQYLIQAKRKLNEKGAYQLVIDPGFGFGKTVQHNYQLLDNLNVYKIIDLPILVGLSRKSMIYKPLELTADQALNGTTVLHTLALERGAKILRVHDVKEAKQAILLHQKLMQSRNA